MTDQPDAPLDETPERETSGTAEIDEIKRDEVKRDEFVSRPTEVRRGNARVIEAPSGSSDPSSIAMPTAHATHGTRTTSRRQRIAQNRPVYVAAGAVGVAVITAVAVVWVLVSALFGSPAEINPRTSIVTASGRAASDELIDTDFGPAVKLKRETFEWSIKSIGHLKPLAEEVIAAKTWGVITRVWDDGKPVKKDDVVLELDSRQMTRSVSDRKAEIDIRSAEKTRTEQVQKKRVASAETSVKQAELELQWQQLNEQMLLAGPTQESLARAEREMDTLSLVANNRSEELRILEDLADQGFATSAEAQSKRLQVAQTKLELAKQQEYLQTLRQGPGTLAKKEVSLQVQIAEYTLDSNRKKLESVRATARSEIARSEQHVTSERNALKQDEERLGHYVAKSPADGYILHVPPRWGTWTPGSRVWRGVRVLSIPSEGQMKVVTKVDQADIGKIEVGTKCLITIPAKPSALLEGEVILLSGQGQDENQDLDGYTKDYVGKAGRQTFEVEVKILAEDRELRPHYRAEVKYLLDTRDEALVVPWGAIKRGKKKDTVMVVEGSKLVERTVELGPSDETSVVIESGCEAGDVLLLAFGGK